MNIFVHDNSFEGLLCAVFDAYTRKIFPDALLSGDDALPLMAVSSHTVRTDPDNAARVFAGLKKKLSPEGREDLLFAWLAEQAGGGTLLFRYLRKVFDATRLIEKDFTDPDVLAVNQLAKKVRHEAHQLMGFVRFQETHNGIYFAAIAPRYNVLPLLLTHFADRLADQTWIIYDTSRHYGICWERGTFTDVWPDENRLRNGRLDAAELADNEALFQELWKGYFRATAIQERTNPRLQNRCLPRRFWKYLTEKQ